MGTNTKNSSKLPECKKSFLHFLVSLCKKISSGCQSDNFDPRRSAYGSSESLCPKFFNIKLLFIIIISSLLRSVINLCIVCTFCLHCFSKACFTEQFICIGEHFQTKRFLIKHSSAHCLFVWQSQTISNGWNYPQIVCLFHNPR